MAFVLIIVALLIFVTAINGTTTTLGKFIAEDVFGSQGQKGYLYWFVSIAIIGAVGYIKPLKQLSDWFIVLVILVLFLGNRGFFKQFTNALTTIGNQAQQPAQTAQPNALPGLSVLPGLENNGLLNTPGGNQN